MSDFKAKMHQIQFRPPPQEPHPRSRPFGPRCPTPQLQFLKKGPGIIHKIALVPEW